MPERPIVRTDIDVPVLDVQSETDIVALRTHLNRQEDHPNFRLWELAGSGHIGEYGRSLTWPPNPTTPGDPCVEHQLRTHLRSGRRQRRHWLGGPRLVLLRRRRPASS